MPDTNTVKDTPLRSVPKASATDASKVMTLFVMLVATLYFGREVLVPIALALLLAFLLAPLVTLFRRAHLGRVFSVLLVVTLALSVLTGIGAVIGNQITELATDLPKYATAIEAKASAVKADTVGRLSNVMNHVQISKQPVASGSGAAAPIASHQGQAVPSSISSTAPLSPSPAAMPEAEPTPWDLIKDYVSPLISPLATIGIVFVVAVFALLQREDLRDRLIRIIGSDDIHRTTVAMDDAGRRLTRYFLTQLTINTIFGIVIGAGLYFIGVPKPALWGILSAILRFIPYVGSFISALLPIALAAAIKPGWSMVLWTASFFVVAEGVTGQALEPLLYGQSTGLSPFSVIVAAIFWSWVWGPVGLFLSTPLTLCLVVMGRHVKRLEFLDILLGDRAPLTPVESFYQRILVDDADEVLEQAEILLKDCSLSTYYDDVALKGMQLAASDAELGLLSAEQLDSVKTTIYELVAGLAEHADKYLEPAKPVEVGFDIADDQDSQIDDLKTNMPHNAKTVILEEQRPPFAVLSIAGRGPLDEPAASMLVQLLNQQGIEARIVKYHSVSRYNIESLDVTNVAMVCIAYLDISGNPAHLRYLIQRLRKRLPAGTRILVGLWPLEDAALKDQDVKEAIGADDLVSSFNEVLSFCISVAQSSNGVNAVPSHPYANTASK